MSDEPNELRIPLIADELSVTKVDVITDRLRVSTKTEEQQVLVEDVVERGELHIERVVVDRAVTVAPEPRQEGDTLVVSVVEERLVVEKRLFVIEEVRITQTTNAQRVEIPETVRRMTASVEHGPTTTTTGSDSNG